MLPTPTDVDWLAFRQVLAQAGIAPEELVGASWTRRLPHSGCAGGEQLWFHPAQGPARAMAKAWWKHLVSRELATHAYQMGSVRLLPRDLGRCPVPDPVPDASWGGHEQDFPILGERVLARWREMDLLRQASSSRSAARRRV